MKTCEDLTLSAPDAASERSVRPSEQLLLAKRLPHAETLIIPEAGHSSYWEPPDIFNRAGLAFIQRVDRQGRSEA
jgi:pimeloyl-ACP methyl ester carboxylesterase